MIGFEELEDKVPENIENGVKLLCVNVSDGQLTNETLVTVVYQNQSAIGKYTTKIIMNVVTTYVH